MKRNIHKNLFGMLRSKGILAISSGLLLVSCGAQMGGYSETDGVYYDPNKDTLPEGVIVKQGNRVGEYYDYYQEDNTTIQNAQATNQEQANLYNTWNTNYNQGATDSDFGNYAGSETNYYDNSWGWGGWGSPWGMYGGWGMGMSFGWGWGNNWGWGEYSPYGWNNGWGWGSGWGMGMYNPYWGYGYPYGGWGAGYYGGGYYGNYYTPYNRRSAASGYGFTNRNSTIVSRNSVPGAGFRNSSGSGFRNSNSGGFRNQGNSGFRNTTTGVRPQSGYRPQGQGGFRNNSGTRPNYNNQSQPRYNNGNSNGGFRNDSAPRSNGGYTSPSNGGGFRGGSSGGSTGGGGGFRSSGGGGGGFRGGR